MEKWLKQEEEPKEPPQQKPQKSPSSPSTEDNLPHQIKIKDLEFNDFKTVTVTDQKGDVIFWIDDWGNKGKISVDDEETWENEKSRKRYKKHSIKLLQDVENMNEDGSSLSFDDGVKPAESKFKPSGDRIKNLRESLEILIEFKTQISHRIDYEMIEKLEELTKWDNYS